jgi:hypothetical protein
MDHYLKAHFESLKPEELEKVFAYKCGDWYDKVDEQDGWLKCGQCGVLPRTWCFNNGRYATCLCVDKYDEKPVRTESVLSIRKRTGLTVEFKPDNLRLRWNVYAETGIPQNKLPEGCW